MDNKYKGLNIKIIRVLVCALVLLFALQLMPSGGFAYADGEVVKLEEQWYAAEQFLNVAAVKALIAEQGFLGTPPEEKLTLAIIDTGITFGHPIFDGITVLEGRSFVSSTAVDDVASVKVYHGTHVAGIAAQFIHYFGLEDYIQILPVKLGDEDANFTLVSGTKSDAVDAIKWAVDNGADVINMSFTSGKSSTITAGTRSQLNDAVAYATAHDVLCVAAAGNESSFRSSQFYPAECTGVIGVTSYDKTGELWSSSNYNAGFELVAPGVGILSSVKQGYAEKNGTSMSSPMVAVAGAILMLKYNYDRGEVFKIMTEYSADTITYGGVTLRKFDMLKMLNYLPPEALKITFDGNEDASSALELYGAIGSLTATADYYRNVEGELVKTESDADIMWTLSDGDKPTQSIGRKFTLPKSLKVDTYTLTASVVTDSTLTSNALTIRIVADRVSVICVSDPTLEQERMCKQILGETREVSFKAMLTYEDTEGNEQYVEYPGAVIWYVNYNNTTRTESGNSRFALPAQTSKGKVMVSAYIGEVSDTPAYEIDGFTVFIDYATLKKEEVSFVYDNENTLKAFNKLYAFADTEQTFMLSGYDYVSNAEYEGILWYIYSEDSKLPICISAQYPRVEYTPEKAGDYKVVCHIDGKVVYTQDFTVLRTSKGAVIALAIGIAAAIVVAIGAAVYFLVIRPRLKMRPPKVADGEPCIIIDGGDDRCL